MVKSELLLPVGNMEMCLAAIHHGADAIYVGVPFFNARGRTTDFTLTELKEMIDLCHLYGVRVNLAFNVVIFEDEFPKVRELLKDILPLGPDAFIVQDLGLASLIREMAPEQRIHASTQMTVTNTDAIRLVDDLKIDRFVLGRENSLSEIKLIRESTDKELEVFVHGALCVAYSGQCFTSESLGGRSANRGQCAQSCRLPYELFVDDVKKEMGEKSYLVSPKDLLGIEEVPALKALGVNSFKVEGRLKTPEYVATAARNYREVLEGGPLNLGARTQELATTYSRGFFSGWLHGVNHQKLVDGTFSAHRGLFLGEIREVKKGCFTIATSTELKPQMGLLIVGEKELGSKIFTVRRIGKNFEVELLQKNLELKAGMKVYLNSDETRDRELQKGWKSREHMKRILLNMKVSGKSGEKLQLIARDPEGREVSAETQSVLSPAQSRALSKEFLQEELSALGTTVYSLRDFHCELEGELFLHQRDLKDLRREIVEKMNRARTQREFFPGIEKPKTFPRGKVEAKLNVLLRTKEQVEAVVGLEGISSVILDFEFGKNYEVSLKLLRDAGIRTGIATTRILKPQEYHNLKLLVRLAPDFILVRNLGALEYLRRESKIPLIGDFSLNVTNSRTLNYLTDKGLGSVNVSYDLNQDQLLELVRAGDPSKIEVTIHQYMPEFHMEHCVFAAFLSEGTSFKDCGKPCEKHEVKLKDPYGNWHFLKADHECRNTFFKATPQSAGFLMETLKNEGVGAVRLEALSETPEELRKKISGYVKLLEGKTSPGELMEELELMESYGLGLGQMKKADSYQDRKKS